MPFKDLDRFITEYEKQHGNSGVVRVTCKDKVIYEQSFGYADREAKKLFTSDSLFSFYSLSKPFLAIGVMKLKDEGKIEIDKHPSAYVPEAEGFDREVTLRNMLHHTSGLPDFELTPEFSQKYRIGLPEQIRGQLREISRYPNLFRPGTDVRYANINMTVCAVAIENITGMSYSDYMAKNVFAPLGMKKARVDRPDLLLPDRVRGYGMEGDRIVPADRTLNWMMGAGDIIGTVDDVYCLNLAIKHKKLLAPKTWEEILTPSPICTFGMGCRVDMWHGKKRIIHNGGHIGFRTLHIQLPEDDFDIIFLSNSGWGEARNDLSEEIFREYYGETAEPTHKIEMDKGYIIK